MKYIPNSIDTSDVIIPKEIESIIESISRNTHEVWAQGRISEGWVLGDIYDGENKKHPSLVPS